MSSGSYRYGFNGKENDSEVKGAGNQQDFSGRIYDTRLGRWFSVDPVTKSNLSSYQYASGNPVNFIDPDGEDEIHFIVLRNVYQDGMGRTFGSPQMKIIVVPKEGPDKFIFHQVEKVHTKTYPSPQSWYQTNVGSPTITFNYFETKEPAQFYPNGDGPNGQGGILNGSGITQSSSGIAPFKSVNDDDFTALAKLAPEELVKYLEKHDPKSYGALRLHQAGLKVGAIAEAVAGASMVIAAPLYRSPSYLNPKEINFMQSSIKNTTGEFTVLGNAEALKAGTLNPKVLRMNVWQDVNGKVWTLDHRRLGAFRLSGLDKAPVKWADPGGQMWKMTTTNGGKSIRLKLGNGQSMTIE